MKTIFRLFLLAGVVALAACFRSDIQRHEIRAPDMKTPEQAQIIARAFNATTDAQAIRDVQYDLNRHVVTVTFDSRRTARRNLEVTVAEAGFPVVLPSAPPAPQYGREARPSKESR